MSHVQDRPLSIPKFTLLVLALTSLNLLTIRFTWPSIWQSEMSRGWWLILLLPATVCVQHLGLAGFEWAFHRWVLHSTGMLEWYFNRPGLHWLYRGLTRFKASHEAHHNRTLIQTKRYNLGPDQIVLSDYSMERPDQFESSAFPWWSLLGFWAFFSVFLIPLHLLLPHLPMLIGGMCAVSMSYWMYEVVHSIHHYPYNWWKKKIADPHFGRYFERRFAFHQYHHYKRRANMGIACFFTFEWWDKALGTYHYPKKLMLHEQIVTAEDIAYHEPCRLVVRIDEFVRVREKRYRRQHPPTSAA